jgi:GHH signature containing HNH/Endo VII superfamily nuclease toxin  2
MAKKGSPAAAPKKGSSTAANTPNNVYMDTFNKSKDCYEDRKKIADKCRDDKNSKEASKDAAKNAKPTTKKNLGSMVKGVQKGIGALDGAAEKAYLYKRNPENGWVQDHCDHLWVKPAGANKDQFLDQIDKLKAELNQNISTVVKDAGGQIVDKAADAAIAYGEKAAIREVASLGSLVIPGVGEVVVAGMTIFNVLDGIWTAGTTAVHAGGQAFDAYKKVDAISQQLNKLADISSGKISPTELWADVMTGVAYVNPCLQARRCQLVPFNQTRADQQARSGKGCCPGQTGHHVLPSEMMEDCKEYTADKERNAPTVCVEGVNNQHGSHGIIHGKLDDMMAEHRKKTGSDSITNDQAIDAGVKSHNETFKPACDPKCLKAQLKSYYDKLCDGKMKPRGGKGTDIEEQGEDSKARTK